MGLYALMRRSNGHWYRIYIESYDAENRTHMLRFHDKDGVAVNECAPYDLNHHNRRIRWYTPDGVVLLPPGSAPPVNSSNVTDNSAVSSAKSSITWRLGGRLYEPFSVRGGRMYLVAVDKMGDADELMILRGDDEILHHVSLLNHDLQSSAEAAGQTLLRSSALHIALRVRALPRPPTRSPQVGVERRNIHARLAMPPGANNWIAAQVRDRHRVL